MYSIKLQNIKGVKEMEFPFPERNGVYVLTGNNGCGKTSLLVALCRLGDNMAFTHYRVNTKTGPRIDTYQNATVTYTLDTESVTYRRKGVRWTASPKNKSGLINRFPFVNTTFISTTGMRFFAQDVFNMKRPTLSPVDNDEIIEPMNEILGTTKFNDLKFITVKGKKGRQRQLHRNNKLYVIKDSAGNFYSELNFSLGERLLLNTLDLLQNISHRSLLLIDEVELALHPVAQIKFYEYLKKQACAKNLAVIISTHSSSLIKHADNRIYLEKNNDGKVAVHRNCYPAFILRTVAAEEDLRPDFIFFVEDLMAQQYLNTVLLKFRNDTKITIDCKVICVGGYREVISLVQSYPALNYDKKHVQAFLDNDVKDRYSELATKGDNRTEAENKLFNLFLNNRLNISYLSITPELGIWNWIEKNANIFKTYVDSVRGTQGFDLEAIIPTVSAEELPNKTGNLRNWAKGCFKNISEKINQRNPLISMDDAVRDMISCYIDNNYNLEHLKSILLPMFHR